MREKMNVEADLKVKRLGNFLATKLLMNRRLVKNLEINFSNSAVTSVDERFETLE